MEYVFIDNLVLEVPLKVDTPSEYQFIYFVSYEEADQAILEVY